MIPALRMKRRHFLLAKAAIDAANANAGNVDRPNRAITAAPSSAEPVDAAVICMAYVKPQGKNPNAIPVASKCADS